jgi:dTDP-4-amino-4,6-dideoxygalactose transaminase
LDECNDRRREIAARYCRDIKNDKVILPELPATPSEHVYHVFVIRLKSEEARDEMQKFLTARGIGTLIHYPIPPHLQEAYAHEFSGEYPIAEAMAKTILSIPMSPVMTDDEVSEVIGAINEF